MAAAMLREMMMGGGGPGGQEGMPQAAKAPSEAAPKAAPKTEAAKPEAAEPKVGAGGGPTVPGKGGEAPKAELKAEAGGGQGWGPGPGPSDPGRGGGQAWEGEKGGKEGKNGGKGGKGGKGWQEEGYETESSQYEGHGGGWNRWQKEGGGGQVQRTTMWNWMIFSLINVTTFFSKKTHTHTQKKNTTLPSPGGPQSYQTTWG